MFIHMILNKVPQLKQENLTRFINTMIFLFNIYINFSSESKLCFSQIVNRIKFEVLNLDLI